MEVLGDFAAVVHQLLVLLHRIPALDRRFAGQRQHLLAHQTLLVKAVPQALMGLRRVIPYALEHIITADKVVAAGKAFIGYHQERAADRRMLTKQAVIGDGGGHIAQML